MFKYYLQIIKPGIIIGNVISFFCTFLFASNHIIHASFFISIIGVSCIIASSCVFNNLIDIDIDQNMKRTKKRYLIIKSISIKNTIFYAIFLALIGLIFIHFSTNFLTLILSIIGFFIYIIPYSLYFKRTSQYGLLIGAISGTIPPILGYCAVKNKIDFLCMILFFIFFIWQIPHFYSISILYLKDYKSINIPIIPIIKNIQITKSYVLFYVSIFIILEILLSILRYAGYFYLFSILVTGIIWIIISLKWKKSKKNNFWARKFFIFSIVAITIFNFMISIDCKSQ